MPAHCIAAPAALLGEVNARLLAQLLNDRDVRAGLMSQGITIQDDTLFLAALHDTTTDDVTLYDGDHPSASHASDDCTGQGAACFRRQACKGTNAPSACQGQAAPRTFPSRSRDWAENAARMGACRVSGLHRRAARPDLGKNLSGRAFLHDYDWRADESFSVLELIITAPVVVASWISLQYYGSTVSPAIFGGGNKLLHNVVGGIGVVEGNGGLLRAGLPWQSVHDGARLVHEPLAALRDRRAAPRKAILAVLTRHPPAARAVQPRLAGAVRDG